MAYLRRVEAHQPAGDRVDSDPVRPPDHDPQLDGAGHHGPLALAGDDAVRQHQVRGPHAVQVRDLLVEGLIGVVLDPVSLSQEAEVVLDGEGHVGELVHLNLGEAHEKVHLRPDLRDYEGVLDQRARNLLPDVAHLVEVHGFGKPSDVRVDAHRIERRASRADDRILPHHDLCGAQVVQRAAHAFDESGLGHHSDGLRAVARVHEAWFYEDALALRVDAAAGDDLLGDFADPRGVVLFLLVQEYFFHLRILFSGPPPATGGLISTR